MEGRGGEGKNMGWGQGYFRVVSGGANFFMKEIAGGVILLRFC